MEAASTTPSPRPRSRRARARHDLIGHTRVLGQLAGHALFDLGHEQVPEHGLLSRAGDRDDDGQPGPGDRPRTELGTLAVGAPADVSVLEVVEGPVEFVDTRNNKRPGKVHLRPAHTVRGGIVYGRPFSAPFSVN